MVTKAQLMEDMKTAMRAHDSVKLNTIRFLNADIKNTEIDNGELDEAGIQKVIMKQVKQMTDVIGDYHKAGRTDLVEEEQAKVAILKTYLPQQMSDAELEAIVDEVMKAQPDATMGAIISQVMPKLQGKAEGSRVSSLVKAKLSA